MAPRSRVYELPPELRDELNQRLVNSGFQGYQGLADWLNEQGYSLSRSAVQRYGQDLREEFEAAMGDVRKTTQMAKALAEADDDSQGALVDVTARMVQEHLLRITIALRNAEHEPEESAKHLARVTHALADIGRMSLGQKKHAMQVRKEAAAEAADKAESAARAQGISDDGVAALRAAIMEGMS